MLSDGQRIAHFEVCSQIGSGGMGVVYKARDLQLERVVALKVLQPKCADDEELRSRLLREARAVSALNHPNIVTVYEAGASGGVDFIAMAGEKDRKTVVRDGGHVTDFSPGRYLGPVQ